MVEIKDTYGDNGAYGGNDTIVAIGMVPMDRHCHKWCHCRHFSFLAILTYLFILLSYFQF